MAHEGKGTQPLVCRVDTKFSSLWPDSLPAVIVPQQLRRLQPAESFLGHHQHLPDDRYRPIHPLVALGRIGPKRQRCERRLDRIGRTKVTPVLSGVVVEDEHWKTRSQQILEDWTVDNPTQLHFAGCFQNRFAGDLFPDATDYAFDSRRGRWMRWDGQRFVWRDGKKTVLRDCMSLIAQIVTGTGGPLGCVPFGWSTTC